MNRRICMVMKGVDTDATDMAAVGNCANVRIFAFIGRIAVSF